MKKHIFRAAAVSAALAGISLLASCGSGLLDTKDEDFETNVLSVTCPSSLSANYGMAGDPAEITVTLTNGTFSEELTAAIANASSTSAVDVTDYFDIKFVDSDGSQYAILRSYSLTATSAVTDAGITAGSTAYVSSQYSFTALLNYKLSTNYTSASAGIVQITANASALAANIAQRSATTLVYSFTTGSYTLLAPTAGTMKSAAAVISADATTFSGLNACARVSLPVPTGKSVSAGEEIGTATIGGKSVTVYAAADCVEEVGVLPVIFTSTEIAYTGAVSITFDSSVANISSEDVIDSESAVATNLGTPYYGEDFEGLTGLSDVGQFSGEATALVSGDATYGTYANVGPTATESGNRSLVTDVTAFNLTDATASNTAVNYCIEFDLAMTPGGQANRSASGIALTDAAPAALYNAVVASDGSGAVTGYDAVVVTAGFGTIPEETTSSTDRSTKYYYYDASGTLKNVTIPSGSWCHYKVNLTAEYSSEGNTYGATVVITEIASGSEVLAETAVKCTKLPSYLWTLAGRYYGSNTLDNIKVYTPCGE